MTEKVAVESGTVRKVVVSGVLGALAILLGWTHVGFIPWVTGAAITIMHVPVIIGAVLEGPLVGAAIGLIFGVFSLLQATLAPTGPTDVFFTNPVVSVVPRLFIGVFAWLTYRAVRRTTVPWMLFIAGIEIGLVGALVYQVASSQAMAAIFLAGAGLGAVAAVTYKALHLELESTALVVAAVVGTFTNTALVLTALGAFGYVPWNLLPPIAVLNGIPEAIVAAILTLAVVVAWKRIETGAQKSRL
jgi:uncharacterized membrane protein